MVKVMRLIKKWVMNEEMEKSEANGRGEGMRGRKQGWRREMGGKEQEAK